MSVPALWPSTLTILRQMAAESALFGTCRVVEGSGSPVLECAAKASGAPAQFCINLEGTTRWVSLVTADRWLSQSIEQDLVHTGDKLTDLLAEELVEVGYPPSEANGHPVEHFRSQDKLFTFRTPIPHGASETQGTAVTVAGQFLRAYEACFRRLGDMEAAEGDDD